MSRRNDRSTRESPGGRAVIDRQTIHIHDMAAEVETEFPESTTRIFETLALEHV